MAITFSEEQSKKKYPDWVNVIIAIVIVSVVAVWFFFFGGRELLLKEDIHVDQIPKQTTSFLEVDFKIFEHPFFKSSEDFPALPTATTTSIPEIGRENPFLPY